MSKIILFNSPKNVGKSKAIEYLNSKGLGLIPAECKEALHKLTMTLFGVDPERYWEIYNTRELKEVALPEFGVSLDIEEHHYLSTLLEQDIPQTHYAGGYNLSIRGAMIYVSEIIVKPRFGSDWFGKERVRKINGYRDIVHNPDKLIFTDDSCAFVDELIPLIEYLGQENILLLRIHRDGFTFEGDSRSYIPNGVIANTIDINNDGTEQQYLDEVEHVVRGFINE